MQSPRQSKGGRSAVGSKLPWVFKDLHSVYCPAVPELGMEVGPAVREELLPKFSWHCECLHFVDNQSIEKLNSEFVAGGIMHIQSQFFKNYLMTASNLQGSHQIIARGGVPGGGMFILHKSVST